MSSHFSYNAIDLEGQVVSGDIAADSEADALQRLAERGLQRPRLVRKSHPLSSEQGDELALVVSDAVDSGLPLAAALRAAALESDQTKMREALNRLAGAIEEGNTLESALVRLDDVVPQNTAALLSSSLRTGAITHVIPEIIEQRKVTRQIWRDIWMMISYPLLILFAAMLLFEIFGIVIVSPFKQMYEEFQLNMPASTLALIWWHDVGAWALLSLQLFMTFTVVFCVAFLSAARRRRIMAWLPVVGPIVHWTSVAELSSLIALMLESGISTQDAVKYAGMSVDDVEIQQACGEISQSVSSGMRLSDAMQTVFVLPPTIVPMVQWGERESKVPDALRAYAESIEQRVRSRGHLIRLLVPMLLMIAIGVFLVFSLTSLFLPMFSLIQGLI